MQPDAVQRSGQADDTDARSGLPGAWPAVAGAAPVPTAGVRWPGQVGPAPDLAVAAAVAVRDLHARLGLDLWLVTRLEQPEQEQDLQVVLAAAGPWTQLAAPGVVLPWAQSFCRQMVAGGAAVAVGDVARHPHYRPIAVGAYAPVRAYLGVPVLLGEQLFGTVCGFGGQPQPTLPAVLQQVTAVGQLLSTIATAQQHATDLRREALRAGELAELDQLTGLRNRRGWDIALAAEQQRCHRYGLPASVLVIDLDGLKNLNDRQGHDRGDAALAACGQALQQACRPGDVVARTGGDEFAVLAVQCDAVSALALSRRIRVQLRSAGVAASIGTATHRVEDTLIGTWSRADQMMYRHKQRHPRPQRQ